MLLAKKIFEFHAQVQKCHFGNFSILPKWHFWTCAWNSKIFLAKIILLKHYENGNKKNIHNLSQGPPNPGLMQEKVQKRDFLKKDSRELKFYFCNFCKDGKPQSGQKLRKLSIVHCEIWWYVSIYIFLSVQES